MANINNSLLPRKDEYDNRNFSAVILHNSIQNLLRRTLGDDRAVQRLTATLLSAVSTSPELAACEPQSIISSALYGEAKGLIFKHGYYIVKYGNLATFVMGYKGYIQLALSTGYYSDIDCVKVVEGEYKGKDPRTGRKIFDLSVYPDDEVRDKQKVIGYCAYYILKDGTYRNEFWPIEDIFNHADKYAPAFKLSKYNDMINGKLSAEEVKKLKKGSAWYDVGGSQESMLKKTVIRSLLKSGYAPLSSEVRYIFDTCDTNAGDVGFTPNLESLSNPQMEAASMQQIAEAESAAKEEAEKKSSEQKAPPQEPKPGNNAPAEKPSAAKAESSENLSGNSEADAIKYFFDEG